MTEQVLTSLENWLNRKNAAILLALISLNAAFYLEVLIFEGMQFVPFLKLYSRWIGLAIVAPLIETPLLYMAVTKFRNNLINGFIVALFFTIGEAAFHAVFFSFDEVSARMIIYYISLRHIVFYLIIVFANYSIAGLLGAIASHAGNNIGLTLFFESKIASSTELLGAIIWGGTALASLTVAWYAVQKYKLKVTVKIGAKLQSLESQ